MAGLTERSGSVWRAGFITGLISATYATAVISLGARQIGRDMQLDWMDVGTVLLRDGGIVARPGWREVLAGIAVHQSADLFWAVTLLGGGIGRLPAGRQRNALLLGLAAPWALLTSAFEYYGLLPGLQPVLKRQTPYWTALSVHLVSGAAYAVFPWIDEAGRGERGDGAVFGRRAALQLGAGLAALARRTGALPPVPKR